MKKIVQNSKFNDAKLAIKFYKIKIRIKQTS